MAEKKKEKTFWEKLKDGTVAVYQFLDGKKRRIALIGGLTAKVFKPYTVASVIGEYVFYLFGGADLLDSSSKAIKNKLPEGLRKK